MSIFCGCCEILPCFSQIGNKLIRATFQCGLVCQTISKEPVPAGKEAEASRRDISCKIVYATNGIDPPPPLSLQLPFPSLSLSLTAVNPGGWAPPAVVRTIGKREITKFLRKFSSTAQKRTMGNPLSL